MSAEQTAKPILAPELVADPAPMAQGDPLRLAAARCPGCGRVEFPRRATCPACEQQMAAIALSPTASLAGFTAVLHQPPDALVQAPYRVGIARFAEGVSVLGLLVDGAAATGTGGADPALGGRLRTVATDLGETCTYAFQPLDDA